MVTLRNYYCDTCDKSFSCDDDLLLHESEHETCGREGCEFTAHPKIIAKHIKMQHDTGLYKRIAKVQAEDVAKWIEERKRRYPSKKVIEEKKILEEEKEKRGERIKDDNSSFNKSFQKNKLNRTKDYEKKSRSKKNRRPRRKKQQSNPSVEKCLQEEERSTVRSGVQAFSGIKNICDPESVPNKKEENIDISDDDEWSISYKGPNSERPLVSTSLSLLAANYNSDEENKRELLKENQVERISDDEGSAPEEVRTVRSTSPLKEENAENNKIPSKRKINPKNKSYDGMKKKKFDVNQNNSVNRQLTLLEKLLRKEIRHERNVILQCVHYVVKNNFFETQ